MNILVLDTIHGGDVIGERYTAAGHRVDTVDVYRYKRGVDVSIALRHTYELVVAPVHLDPDHPLLRSQQAPVISHHEAVRRLIGEHIPQPMVEITGARGKTTTAFALAHIMKGAGVLHTSAGTYLYPERKPLWKRSITPASVLAAVDKAREVGGWLIAEESLGVSGAGTLGIITSHENYRCAAGKKSALAEKLKSIRNCQEVLLAPNIHVKSPAMVHLEDIARCCGTVCRIDTGGVSKTFQTPLLELEGYRTSLMLAGAATCLLGFDPSPLSTFQPVDGRLSVERVGAITIVDNANSGTNAMTTIDAALYARAVADAPEITLVIGMDTANGAVCEGFPDRQILDAIRAVAPERIILVGNTLVNGKNQRLFDPDRTSRFPTLPQAREAALSMTKHGSIVLAVKTWR